MTGVRRFCPPTPPFSPLLRSSTVPTQTLTFAHVRGSEVRAVLGADFLGPTRGRLRLRPHILCRKGRERGGASRGEMGRETSRCITHRVHCGGGGGLNAGTSQSPRPMSGGFVRTRRGAAGLLQSRGSLGQALCLREGTRGLASSQAGIRSVDREPGLLQTQLRFPERVWKDTTAGNPFSEEQALAFLLVSASLTLRGTGSRPLWTPGPGWVSGTADPIPPGGEAKICFYPESARLPEALCTPGPSTGRPMAWPVSASEPPPGDPLGDSPPAHVLGSVCGGGATLPVISNPGQIGTPGACTGSPPQGAPSGT